MTQRQFAKEFGDLVLKYKKSRKNKCYNVIEAVVHLDKADLESSRLYFSSKWRDISVKIKVGLM